MRPSVTCEIKVKESLTNEEINEILNEVKRLITVEFMREIARDVDWNLEISAFYLYIKPDSGGVTKRYFTKYYKSSNASDPSTENIDGYRTWFEESE